MIYRPYIAILALLLCALACASQPTQAKQALLANIPVVEPSYQIVTVTGNVNVRYEGVATGVVAEKGMRLVGYIEGDYFRLLSGETVWLGCTSVGTKGCQAK